MDVDGVGAGGGLKACPLGVAVRDSKLGAHSPRFGVPAGAWTAFLKHL
ncbi:MULTISPECIES: DUF397 domain-containing protein [unclassified Streptomyces]|nr:MULTISPECIES: DUF397 domain-containing protein [unclassified Streptomyces]